MLFYYTMFTLYTTDISKTITDTKSAKVQKVAFWEQFVSISTNKFSHFLC